MVIAQIPARAPCKRYDEVRSRRGRGGYESVHTVASKPAAFWTDIPSGRLDRAAALLLPILNNPGLRLYGRTADGASGELFVPVFHTDSSQTVARWINQRVADWREGGSYGPPLVSITGRWAWSGELEIQLL
jgi:hypothetical protein